MTPRRAQLNRAQRRAQRDFTPLMPADVVYNAMSEIIESAEILVAVWDQNNADSMLTVDRIRPSVEAVREKIAKLDADIAEQEKRMI